MLEIQQLGFNFGGGLNEQIWVDNNIGITPGTPSDPDSDSDSDATGLDFDPLIGRLQLGATLNTPVAIGGLTMTGSVFTSNSPGDPLAGGLARLAGQSLVVQNNSAASVAQKVIVGDTGYRFPTGTTQWGMQLSANLQGTISIRTRAWDDPGSKQFGGSDGHTDATAQLLFDDLETSTFNKMFSGMSLVGPGPYSKTIEFDITLAPGASITLQNNQLQSTAVPEPPTLIGAVFATVALAVLGLRRRLASKAA
jgi:hypothetical protein